MKNLIYLLVILVNCNNLFSQDTLPDNYLPFSLNIFKDRLEGESEYLEGFRISMNLPKEFLKDGFNIVELITLIRIHQIVGTLKYPNGRTTKISYEIVNHRKCEDIYMKATLGYFLLEMLEKKDNKILFAINWWYCPPATEIDLETLNLAESLLSDSTNWHQNDDRKCEEDEENNLWSLFCALKYASIEKMKEYNHHNTDIQKVRFVIDDLIPNNGYVCNY